MSLIWSRWISFQAPNSLYVNTAVPCLSDGFTFVIEKDAGLRAWCSSQQIFKYPVQHSDSFRHSVRYGKRQSRCGQLNIQKKRNVTPAPSSAPAMTSTGRWMPEDHLLQLTMSASKKVSTATGREPVR